MPKECKYIQKEHIGIKTSIPYELLEGDLVGRFLNPEKQGAYVLTLMDSFMRFYWAFMMKGKKTRGID